MSALLRPRDAPQYGDRQALFGINILILWAAVVAGDEVRDLNLAARERLKSAGELGQDVTVATE